MLSRNLEDKTDEVGAKTDRGIRKRKKAIGFWSDAWLRGLRLFIVCAECQ